MIINTNSTAVGRMISVGKLGAGCVPEINNPIQGLLTLTDLMQSLKIAGLRNRKRR
jgi:hypothetical protein